jgi:hypothetical protein
VPGRWESLWSFFKTAEFWRNDLLLTPVLLLDQFEELFTLQTEEVRAHFLNELSYLIRGVRPPPTEATPPGEQLSEHPPPLRIVLSLREDCLGLLEDAAEHIPQILDARFRLAPLDLPAAHEAIVRPAAVIDPGLATPPFAVDPAAAHAMLNYLSHASTPIVGQNRRYIEPFQLQLICRRMEQIAGTRQQALGASLTITMADLGGEAALDKTLRDFYTGAIRSLPDRRGRRASRRLCEKHLISTDGRRLSLEEHEIHRELRLPRETLSRLEAARLLRSESRSDNTYYELSHDALVEPILASSRYKARVMAMFGIGYAALLILINLVYVIGAGGAVLGQLSDTKDRGDVVQLWSIACIVVLLLLPLVVLPVTLLRGSARSWRRYRRSRKRAIAGSRNAPASSITPVEQAVVGDAKSPSTPGAWYSDPTRRYEFRWWDGSRWTQRVATKGSAMTDPVACDTVSGQQRT